MDRLNIEKELKATRKKLEICIANRKKAKNDISDLEKTLKDLMKSKSDTESMFDGILYSINLKGANLSKYSKFKDTYYNKVKNILKGPNATDIIESIQSSISKIKKKILDLDDAVDEYDKKINIYYNKIFELEQQLKNME